MRLALREVWVSFRRAPSLAILSVTTIAFSLFAVGLFGLVSINIRSALHSIESRVEIRAFLKDSVPQDEAMQLVTTVRTWPGVAGVGYVSSDSALSRARAELTEFRDVMEGTTLPASVEVRLEPGARDPATILTLVKQLEATPVVDDVRYGREWVEKIYRIRTLASVAGIALGITFALVAIIIIGATIRMAILARAREIEIMRLVGATNAFMRLPYVLDGAIKGTIGGLIAVGLTWATHRVVSSAFLPLEYFAPADIALGVMAGAAIGTWGSWYSVGRQLRRVWRD